MAVGTAVEKRLIQLLGGPYHDKKLVADLKRAGSRLPAGASECKISIADQSTPALYPLPGGRAIVTRGLLAEVRSREELESILEHAAALSINIYAGRVTRDVAEATKEVLLASTSMYNPDSADIRLARLLERNSCVLECLVSVRRAEVSSDKGNLAGLPASIKQLATLRSGYELLETAQNFEKHDDQAQAVATYLQAAALAPEEPHMLGSLGLAYLRAGQLQPARLHLQKAVKLQPDYYRTWMGLGYSLLQQGNSKQANETLANSVRLLPVAENLFLLAEAREKSGDVEGALSLYRLVAESDRYGKLGRTAASRLTLSGGGQ
jgi:tetratricopeptide (TPR) repeat protein